MPDILMIVIQFAIVLFALSVHESAHGWMANRLGDPTARLQGRISLNPLAHIDPIGTVVFPLILALLKAPVFGWAKPVMIDPRYFRRPRRDNMLVAAAGPLSNLLVAALGILLFRLFTGWLVQNPVPAQFLLTVVIINVYLAAFNLIPIPPLDGSRVLPVFLSDAALLKYHQFERYGILIFFGALMILPRVLGFSPLDGYFKVTVAPLLQLFTGIAG